MAEALGWRWEFGVQLPPLLLCLTISAVAIPDTLGVQGGQRKAILTALREFDAKGSLLLTLSVSFLILGLVRSMFVVWGGGGVFHFFLSLLSLFVFFCLLCIVHC